jgi:acetyl esterase/lipase
MNSSAQSVFGETYSWFLRDVAPTQEPAFVFDDAAAPTTDLVIRAVSRAQCFAFAPERPNGGAALILAGGGYTQLVVGKEGVQIAHWLNTLGFYAFVLVHRFPNAEFGAQAPLDDAIEAMRAIRARAPTLGITRVGALGLSSGGHLAASLIARYPAQWTAPPSAHAGSPSRPDFLVVGYGPISTNAAGRTIIANKPPLPPPEKQALYDAMQPDAHLIDAPPPTFIVYAASDPVVPVENGRRLHAALESKGVAAELHVFADAPHGFALRERALPVGLWPDLCAAWLRQTGNL